MKKICIAADHAGFQLKEFLVGYLSSKDFEVFDFGCHSEESCDYPDVGHPLAEAVSKGEFERGISVCGSGVGISIVVNKHRGVRGALCWEPEIAKLCRQHNDANVLCLPARFMDNDTAIRCLENFLSTPFEGGRHQKRVDKIEIE
jgi:ribose 5-phosphate isomerase B